MGASRKSFVWIEMRVPFESLIERFEYFELTSPYEWVAENRFFGLKRLPVRAVRIWSLRDEAGHDMCDGRTDER